MPSKKPIIHFNTDQWLIDKMKYIASENNRSLAKEMEYLCKQRIKEYELECGEIEVEESQDDQIIGMIKTLCEKMYKDVLKKAEKNGSTPRKEWGKYLDKVSEKKKNQNDFKLIQKYVEELIEADENK